MPADPFIHNEHGAWCPSCGEHITGEDLDFVDCPTCGFPDDGEAMARYHNMDDGFEDFDDDDD